jgi:transmembrane sensor
MSTLETKPSAAARAEAAAWVARLHGPNRTPEAEAGLRRWLAESPEHAAAFELLTDTWEKSARLRRRPIEQVASWERPGFRISVSRAITATAATVILAVVGTLLYLRTDAVTTGIGEFRVITLEDGTRVHLNTNTRARIRYDKRVRQVSLDNGEALFEVARHSDRPFIVIAGSRQIRALGTEFVVRRRDQDVAITLVEGVVAVAPAAASVVGPMELPPAGNLPTAAQSPQTESLTLTPGQRVTFNGAESPRVDRPALARVTAWERGEVALDNMSLADAVAEMNRYSREPLAIVGPGLEEVRVSGIFQAGDSANFARALSRAYHIRVEHRPDGVTALSRPIATDN